MPGKTRIFSIKRCSIIRYLNLYEPATERIHFSQIILQLSQQIKLIAESTMRFNFATFNINLIALSNDRKWKFHLFFVLRYVKQMFSFWGFWNTPFGSPVIGGQKCFQFVSFGCFCFSDILIISVLQSQSRFSRKGLWFLISSYPCLLKKNSRAEVRVAHQCPIHYFRKR